MRLLVFGRSGQVATALRELCTRGGIAAEFLGRGDADLTDPKACAARIAETPASIVINAAAYTAVDDAETDAATAQLVNAAAPTAMARATALKRLPFLHISTDYVFDGSDNTGWAENSPTGPLGVYGASKLAGEQGVAGAGGAYVILRTAWVFSAQGDNFVKTMLRLGANRNQLQVVNDQRGNPTAAADIAQALITIAHQFEKGTGVCGIYHFAGAPAVNRAEFAAEIFNGVENAPAIVPVSSETFPTAAKRPGNSVLNCGKIRRDFGLGKPDWRDSLRTVKQKIRSTP